MGQLALDEQLWRRGPRTLRPFCTRAQVKARTCSKRLQRAITDFGADHAFAAAATKVKEHYGVSVPVDRARTVTLQHAHVLAAQEPQPVRTLPARGPAHIVAEADGTMVPIVDTSAAPPLGPTGASTEYALPRSSLGRRAGPWHGHYRLRSHPS